MFDTCYNLHFKSVEANSEMLAFLLPLMFCNSKTKTKNPKHEYMSPSTLFSPLTQNVMGILFFYGPEIITDNLNIP